MKLQLQLLSYLVGLFITISSCSKTESASSVTHTGVGGAPPVVNQPPVANAGPDQTITLPTSVATLDGRSSVDPENNIMSYQWRLISGPSSFTILTPNNSQTQVSDLVPGIYAFELTVSDAGGLLSKDTVEISVITGGTTEIFFGNQIWINVCYDPRPGVCWINGDGPSYGFFIRDTANIIPDNANAVAGVWVRMDTSSVWQWAPHDCFVLPTPYPQTDFTYCLSSDGLWIYSWFYSSVNLEGRKADLKIRF